jgi:hypothetical protein
MQDTKIAPPHIQPDRTMNYWDYLLQNYREVLQHNDLVTYRDPDIHSLH